MEFSANFRFELRILRALYSNKELFARTHGLLRPDDFSDVIIRMLFSILSEFFATYSELPDIESLLRLAKQRFQESCEELDIQALAHSLANLEIKEETPFVIDEILRIVREKRLKAVLYEAIKHLENKEIEMAEHRLSTLAQPVYGRFERGHDFFSEIDKRLEKRRIGTRKSFPTLYSSLDIAANGGLRAGELGVVVGIPGLGKSTFLQNLTFNFILQAYKVLYISTEQSEQELGTRFDVMFSNIELRALKEKDSVVKAQLEKFVGQRLKLVLKQFVPCTMSELTGYLSVLGEDFDILIVDWADMVIPTKRYSERRFELAQIFQDLKDLASKSSVVVWTATQADSRAIGKRRLDLKNLSESKIGKGAIPDLIVGIAQNSEDRERGILRCSIIKSRFTSEISRFNLVFNFENLRLIQNGCF